MRKLAGVLLCAALAVLAWRAGVVVPRDLPVRDDSAVAVRAVADDLFTPAALRSRLERIAPIVSEVVGFPLDLNQINIVAMDDRVAAERAMWRLCGQRLNPVLDEFSQRTVSRARSLEKFYGFYLGLYRADEGLIVVFPDKFDSVDAGGTEAVFDIVLAHELAHAWQDQSFHVLGKGSGPSTVNADHAWHAVVEGSAEFVARKVARRLGIEDVFIKFRFGDESQKDAGQDLGSRKRRRTRYFRSWAYSAGYAYIQWLNVAKELDWNRLFSQPPTAAWEIERPRSRSSKQQSVEEPLDRWAEQFVWCQEVDRGVIPYHRRWGYWPLTQYAVWDRLQLAEIASADAVWNRCRGGLLVAGVFARGGLARSDTELRVWRMHSGEDAVAARAGLEAAAASRGGPSWLRDDSIEFFGPIRRSETTDGIQAFGQSGMVAKRGRYVESTCAYAVHGSFLIEAITDRVGATAALLELVATAVQCFDLPNRDEEELPERWANLDTVRGSDPAAASLPMGGPIGAPMGTSAAGPVAVRDELIARVLTQPDGERDVLQWLQARPLNTGAVLAALARAHGEVSYNPSEKNGLILAALRHPDADVRRFALASIAEDRVAPGPLTSALIPLLREAIQDKDASVRALGVWAAHELDEGRVFSREQIERLVSDPALVVRASLARSPGLLRKKGREALREDSSELVRRLAASEKLENSELDILGQGLDDYGFLISHNLGKELKENREPTLARIRELLGSEHEFVRVAAIEAVVKVNGDRSTLMPGLLAAFDAATCRRAATQVLTKGGFDLEPTSAQVLQLLDNQFCRVQILRASAANEFSIPINLRPRVRAWMNGSDSALACAAALALFDHGPEPANVLQKRWSSVHIAFRVQILKAILHLEPESAHAEEMRDKALLSPFREIRRAVFESVEDSTYSEVHVEALLNRMTRGGREVVEECWDILDSCISGIRTANRISASDTLTRYLNKWCDRDRLPEMPRNLSRNFYPGLEHWFPTLGLLDALDRCIVRSDADSTRLVFALLRRSLEMSTKAESAEVSAATNNLIARIPLPDTHRGSNIWSHSTMSSEVVRSYLRGRAQRPKRRRSFSSYVFYCLDGDVDRERVARTVLSECLRRGDEGHITVALEILDALKSVDVAQMKQIKACAARALPSWRKKFDARIAALRIVEAPPR